MKSVKSDKIKTNKMIEILKLDEDIEYIQPNFIYKSTTNDSEYSNLW
ncbi:MAG: hypothetical protein U9Q66_02615 [Patescibacteria group bacterium]|nr:hypothetical protein [Patescibacteria group bacterium]